MKKLGILLAAAIMMSSAAYAKNEMFTGLFWLDHGLASKGQAYNQEWGFSKAEINIKNDVFFAEFNVRAFNMNQGYFMTKLMGNPLNLGRIQTGIGKLNYFSTTMPWGSVNSELQGDGFTLDIPMDKSLKVVLGNFGHLLGTDKSAESGATTKVRHLYGGVAMNVMSKTDLLAVVNLSTNANTSDNNIDLIAELWCKDYAPMTVNGLVRASLSNKFGAKSTLISAAVNYEANKDVNLYGSLTLPLTDDTKTGDVESDLIFGASYNLDENAKLLAEYQTAKQNSITCREEMKIGAALKF
jgi:hypothetical protein